MSFAFIVIGSTTVLAVLAVIILVKLGRARSEKDTLRRVLNDIHAANTIRDHMHDNPDTARRVRKRFTR